MHHVMSCPIQYDFTCMSHACHMHVTWCHMHVTWCHMVSHGVTWCHMRPGLHACRMQAAGVDNSTKLSPYMAAGCLSPRMVLQELVQLQAAAQQHGCPEAECGWLHMHLVIRDFFTFTALKEGQAMMGTAGIKGVPVEWSSDADTFARWAQWAQTLSGRSGPRH